jgi:magnesium transporter
MAQDVISVKTSADQEEVARLVAEYNLLAIPVVDDEDTLVGIVTVDDVIDVLQEEAAEDLLALAGVTAEERVTTSASRSLRLRAPWLLVNLATTFLPAYVIYKFGASIVALPELAALVTMPMGMGGNAATQTLTVIIRGLALNEVSEVARITAKQIMVGIGNGLINGLVAGVVGIAISRRLWVGVVLALAMVINMVVSAVTGVLIPIALKRLRIDPAVASTVFVTTFTDLGGSLSFLGLATVFMKISGLI